MSVFQLQEWWGLKVSQDNEEFDFSCFAVGNVDNASPPTDKIAIASQQGILRIYHPTKPQFRIEDLIYEGSLGAPILQVLLGRFIPSNETLALAILHPRELVVYEVLPQGGKDGRVNFHTLQKLYKHDLGVGGKHFTAYNMCHGPFGGSRGRDMILVQSLDGKLQIFEQSANAFSRQLVECLIPGPIAYLPKLDAFITTNHACQAECYRYQVLASSQGDVGVKSSDLKEGKSESISSLTMQKVRPALVEWSVNLGEPCRQILIGSFSSTTTDSQSSSFSRNGNGNGSNAANSEVLFICEKSIFLVKAESGGVIQQRRLDRSEASCATLVPCEGGHPNSYNFILAGQDGTVQVYANFNLVWAARLASDGPIVHASVGTFGGVPGLIVTLDDDGRLSISYLGTKPPVTAVLSHVRDLDYEKIDEEHRALLNVIREAQTEGRTEPVEKLLIKSQLSRGLEVDGMVDREVPLGNLVPLFPPGSAHLSNIAEQVVKTTVRLFLSSSGDRSVSNVSITVAGPSHLLIIPQQVQLTKVGGLRTTPEVIKVVLYAIRGTLPTTSDIVVTASYTSIRGEPRVTTHTFMAPLCCAIRPRLPNKTASCKVVLDTDYPAVALTDLFSDVLQAYNDAGLDLAEGLGGNATQALGFSLVTGPSSAANSLSASLTSPGAKSVGGLGVSLSSPSNTSTSSVVSILVSKNAGRYRLQADSYPQLVLLLAEVEKRLKVRLSTMPNANLSVMSPSSTVAAPGATKEVSGEVMVRYLDTLPLEDYFSLIEQHLVGRMKLMEMENELELAAQRFRLVQKRLLVRFKDRHPSPLHGLDLVLQEVYADLLRQGDSVEAQQKYLQLLEVDLAAFSRLISHLIIMKNNLSSADRVVLQAHLCPEAASGSAGPADQGWEETVTASLNYLLRTTLSKSGGSTKESSNSAGMASSSSSLEIPKNTDALRKALQQVMDRLEKGLRLAPAAQASGAQSPSPVPTPSTSSKK
eukprot:gene894-978_t